MASTTTTSADQADRRLATVALEKTRLGQKPTSQEAAALRRVQAAHDEESRWQHYKTIPQKHWREMSGRQAKIINEQATRYGIPFAGATVDLPAVVKSLHDFFAQKHDALGESDEMLAIKTERERIKLNLDRGSVVPREEIREGFAAIAGAIRRAGDRLQRQFGPEAHKILEEALSDVEQRLSAPGGLTAE